MPRLRVSRCTPFHEGIQCENTKWSRDEMVETGLASDDEMNRKNRCSNTGIEDCAGREVRRAFHVRTMGYDARFLHEDARSESWA
jgi:hypothetical protein